MDGFLRLSACCVESELTIEVHLNFHYDSYGAFKRIAQKYYVTAWFEMEDGITAEFGDFKLRRPRKRSDIVKLDEYLVPVFKWDDIEEEAENIILDIVSEGLSDPQRIQPGLFVEHMGLKLVYLPLYKRPRTSSSFIAKQTMGEKNFSKNSFTICGYEIQVWEATFLARRIRSPSGQKKRPPFERQSVKR